MSGGPHLPTLDELLAAHAAGRLAAPVALLVATHLALSPGSRKRYANFEAVGGAFLDRIEPARLGPGAWDRLCARLDREEPAATPAPVPEPLRGIPRPLRDRIPGSLDLLPWRELGDAAEAELEPGAPGGHRVALLRVRAGRPVPAHTHEGHELTLVLEGAYRDADGRYARGDVAMAGPGALHRAEAEPGRDCLCLQVTERRRRPARP